MIIVWALMIIFDLYLIVHVVANGGWQRLPVNGSMHITNLAAMLIYKKYPKIISFYGVFIFYAKMAGVVYAHWLLGTIQSEKGDVVSFTLALQ